MLWFTLFMVLVPLLETIQGLPVRVRKSADSDDEWDDLDFEGDFDGPSYDDPSKYMKKTEKKVETNDVWKLNMNITKNGKRF